MKAGRIFLHLEDLLRNQVLLERHCCAQKHLAILLRYEILSTADYLVKGCLSILLCTCIFYYCHPRTVETALCMSRSAEVCILLTNISKD